MLDVDVRVRVLLDKRQNSRKNTCTEHILAFRFSLLFHFLVSLLSNVGSGKKRSSILVTHIPSTVFVERRPLISLDRLVLLVLLSPFNLPLEFNLFVANDTGLNTEVLGFYFKFDAHSF